MSEEKLQDLEVQFKVHETQCEERWKTIFARIEGCLLYTSDAADE